jgi:glutaminyl-peptide cyclotransferase
MVLLSKSLNYTTMGVMSLTISLLFFMVLSTGCSDKKKPTEFPQFQSDKSDQPEAGKSRIIQPLMNQRIKMEENMQIILENLAGSPDIDSVIFLVEDKKVGKADSKPFLCNWHVSDLKVGECNLKTQVYYKNNTTGTNFIPVVILPDKKPILISYKVLNVYPHDIRAYTQGLIYEKGDLYEGTGQYNESSLRKVDIKTGEPSRILNLPGDIFGEGITIFGNKIYQLTYKSQVGFVYDKESFERLQKVYYENKEGWGLTQDGTQLIMSDGSNLIYFMDPEYFTEISRLEVYDEKGPVERLNELEYIDGKIYANIYGSNEIVIIDPESGAIIAKMNFNDILAEKDKHNRIDVFNGIAYNPDHQSLYVTGKYWPKLFEVKLLEKP